MCKKLNVVDVADRSHVVTYMKVIQQTLYEAR